VYFDLTDEQKAIREAVADLLRDKVSDRHALQQFNAGKLETALWEACMDQGLASILVPSEQGGLGMDMLTLSVVAETLARFAAPGPVTANALAAWAIATAGDAGQRAAWVPALMSGKSIAAFAFLEPGVKWLSDQWTLEGPSLSGVKECVEWGERADVLLVGLKGGQLAIVDAHALGVCVTPVSSLDRARPLAQVTFTASPCTLLGPASMGARVVDANLVLLAAEAYGASARAYEMAVEYAKNRTQFDRVIGRFQALKHQLANMAVDVEPCRSLYWYAAHAWDSLPEDRSRAAAMAKAHVTEIAVKTARAALEAHGGIGYTWEYPLHLYLKRAMYARNALGAPPLHRERMAALSEW
jgi:alkylation response protein AidB-like acyl-CoA dehydrogenase